MKLSKGWGHKNSPALQSKKEPAYLLTFCEKKVEMVGKIETMKLLTLLLPFILFALAASSVEASRPRLDFKLEVKQEGIGEFTQNLSAQNTSVPLIFRVYVYNPNSDLITNARLKVTLSDERNGKINAQAMITADQIPNLISNAVIYVGENNKIVPIEGMTRVFGYEDSVGTPISGVSRGSALLDPGISISHINGGDVIHKNWYVFKASVEQLPQQQVIAPTVKKTPVQPQVSSVQTRTEPQDTQISIQQVSTQRDDNLVKGEKDQLPVTGGSSLLLTLTMIPLGLILMKFIRHSGADKQVKKFFPQSQQF